MLVTSNYQKEQTQDPATWSGAGFDYADINLRVFPPSSSSGATLEKLPQLSLSYIILLPQTQILRSGQAQTGPNQTSVVSCKVSESRASTGLRPISQVFLSTAHVSSAKSPSPPCSLLLALLRCTARDHEISEEWLGLRPQRQHPHSSTDMTHTKTLHQKQRTCS